MYIALINRIENQTVYVLCTVYSIPRSMRNLSLTVSLKCLPAPIDLVLFFCLDKRFISYSGYFDSTS